MISYVDIDNLIIMESKKLLKQFILDNRQKKINNETLEYYIKSVDFILVGITNNNDSLERYCNLAILPFKKHAEGTFVNSGLLPMMFGCNKSILITIYDNRPFTILKTLSEFDNNIVKQNYLPPTYIQLDPGHYDIFIPKPNINTQNQQYNILNNPIKQGSGALNKIIKINPENNVKNIIYYNENGNIDSVIKHQKNRFAELDSYLNMHPSAHVIIAGEPKENKHYLGTGIAKNTWEEIDIQKYILMNANLNTLTQNLIQKYPTRVKYGKVGNRSNFKPGPNLLYVWGANEGNWNLEPGEMIIGEGQAAGMGIQRQGVFGIVTMPTTNSKLLFEKNKTKY